jgi:nucleoside-diphosphate-sugar epimerase
MNQFPKIIKTTAELDELLSRPTSAVVESLSKLDGDIMILGAGGKIGPTIARMAKRAVESGKLKKEVYAVDVNPMPALEKEGIKTVTCDLMSLEAVEKLPKVKNVVYMVGRKFGSTGAESLTWAVNVIISYHVARAFTGSRISAFSTGCVYPVMHINTCGATEQTAAAPVGEYAMSCLGRERMFDYYSDTKGAKVAQIRLNYSVEVRYGVLVDVGTKVWNGEAVDVTTGFANCIWQGDASAQVLQSLEYASSPAKIFNITGPETVSIRAVANEFARIFGKEAKFTGTENGMGYLSNATYANKLFGNPTVPVGQVIEWAAHWIMNGGENIGKPTHFETQNGKY